MERNGLLQNEEQLAKWVSGGRAFLEWQTVWCGAVQWYGVSEELPWDSDVKQDGR